MRKIVSLLAIMIPIIGIIISGVAPLNIFTEQLLVKPAEIKYFLDDYSNNLGDMEPNFIFPFPPLPGSPPVIVQPQNWGLAHIGVPDALRITSGSPYVIVGIIDSGIDGNHPYLRPLIHPNPNIHRNFIPNNSASPLTDLTGHGTRMAGVIATSPGITAASISSEIGALSLAGNPTGVARNIRLASLMAFTDREGGLRSIAQAINHAIDHNIRILNFSGYSTDGSYPPFELALARFRDFGGIIINSAGNGNRNTDNVRVYPASLSRDRFPNLISVGGSNRSDNRFGGIAGIGGSNFGLGTVDLFAPGADIRTTNRGGGFSAGAGNASGTSIAAAFVSGVAALVLSVNPSLDGIAIRRIIMDSAENISSLRGISISGGRVNAYRAVRMATGQWIDGRLRPGTYQLTPQGMTRLNLHGNDNTFDVILTNPTEPTWRSCSTVAERIHFFPLRTLMLPWAGICLVQHIRIVPTFWISSRG